MPKVSVSRETAILLSTEGLLDPVTGEVHQVVRKHKVPMAGVASRHIRVSKFCADWKETGWAVSFLKECSAGIVCPKGTTQRWRMRFIVSKGNAIRVGKGRYVLNPKLWSDGSLPKHLLPDKFK